MPLTVKLKVALAERHARERERAPRPFRSAHALDEEKNSSLRTPF